MILISDEMENLISHQKLGYVATVNPDNTPNLSPKGTLMVWKGSNLVFADIKSPQTISNIEKNSSVEINVVDPFSRKGFRFRGKASIQKEGKEYSEIITKYSEMGVKSKINKIVIIKVEKVSEVISPLYDLGFNESQIRERWKKHYQT